MGKIKSEGNPSIQCSVCGKWRRLHGTNETGIAIQRFYSCCGENGEHVHEKEVCDECCKKKCPYRFKKNETEPYDFIETGYLTEVRTRKGSDGIVQYPQWSIGENYDDTNPTHWMPLPKPPQP